MARPAGSAARWRRTCTVLVTFLLFAGVAGRAETGEVRVAVVLSHQGAPFLETLRGFRDHLEKRGIRALCSVHSLEGDPARVAAVYREIRGGHPDLLFTLGLLATESAAREIPDVPVVAGMVPRADALRRNGRRAVVQLDFPVDAWLRWIRRVLPDSRTVGVIYNAEENRGRIGAAVRAARDFGLSVEAREVRSPRDIPAALESLRGRADVLWGLYDSIVTTPETARRILLFSFRHRVPVVGPSVSWVKAGALFALEWDHADMGEQCGELAAELLRGRHPGTLPAVPPRKAGYVINMNTAARLGVGIPEPLARGARQTFRGGE